jgi:hypothetical protein
MRVDMKFSGGCEQTRPELGRFRRKVTTMIYLDLETGICTMPQLQMHVS